MNFSPALFILSWSCAIQSQALTPAEVHRLWTTPTALVAKGETVGVEVEGVLPGQNQWDVYSRMRFEVVNILEHSTGVARVAPHPLANFIEFDFNGRTHVFTIKLDGTIKPPQGFFGIEITSPIMHNEQELEIFTHIVSELNSRLGYTPEPSSTGLHVHLGFKDSSEEEKKLTLLAFEALESTLHAHFKPNPGRRGHLASVVGQTDRWSAARLDFIGFLTRIHGEFPNIRMSHLREGNYGTIEVRFFNSTMNRQKIIQAVNLVRFVIAKIRLRDPLLLKLLIDEIPPEELLNEVLSPLKVKCVRLLGAS
ncbi:MAG: amidoligase family protein [Bdellovibrionaceae bacterium]|nr:amidoligase family protein [Pseudobdellovibrionaceae bacterium]